MKLLNLDELAPVAKSVIIRGQKYQIKELGVGAFLEAVAESKGLESKDDVLANFESAIRQIKRLIPDLDETVIRELTLEQMHALMSFLNGTLDELKQAGEGAAGN